MMVWKNVFPLKYGHVGYLCQFLGGVTAANNYYTSLMLKFPMFSDYMIWQAALVVLPSLLILCLLSAAKL